MRVFDENYVKNRGKLRRLGKAKYHKSVQNIIITTFYVRKVRLWLDCHVSTILSMTIGGTPTPE